MACPPPESFFPNLSSSYFLFFSPPFFALCQSEKGLARLAPNPIFSVFNINIVIVRQGIQHFLTQGNTSNSGIAAHLISLRCYKNSNLIINYPLALSREK